MECIVCCSTLTSRPVRCEECEYETCEKCVETYLLEITNDPHCMNCRCVWDMVFLRGNLRAEFLEGCFRERRREVDCHRSQRQEDPDVLCSCPSCPNGRVSRASLACMTCLVKVCAKCFCEKEKLLHECREEVICSLEWIRKITRPCPGCYAPIEKQSGCFQMFCTHCFTAFDWNNGSVLDKNNLHNPHYTEHKSSIDNLQKMITDSKMKMEYQKFHRLVLDIGHQMIMSSREDLYTEKCIQVVWSNYYKRGLRIIREKSYHEMQVFQSDLKEVLLEYNEQVKACLQLRGHRLFPPANPSLFCM